MPKALFLFLGFLVLSSTGLSAQQQAGQATRRPITVQGILHETLTALHGDKPHPKPGPHLGDIDPVDIQCWAGYLDPTITAQYVDSAYLLVKWTDGKRAQAGEVDSMLVWGYVWNTISIYVDPTTGKRDTFPVTKHTIDMLRAVANADCRFLLLLQQTGAGTTAVGGIGYNYADNRRVPVTFNQAGATADARVKFRYVAPVNCDSVPQTALPFEPESQTKLAIQFAVGGTPATSNGIIEHPFNANYGYPAYDYDYWVLTDTTTDVDHEWQAGWYDLYWSFYNGENLQIPATYSSSSVNTRVLQANSTDGFVPNDPNDSRWPPAHDMSGDYTVAEPCRCNLCPPRPPKKTARP